MCLVQAVHSRVLQQLPRPLFVGPVVSPAAFGRDVAAFAPPSLVPSDHVTMPEGLRRSWAKLIVQHNMT
jgi:hypothetical protein